MGLQQLWPGGLRLHSEPAHTPQSVELPAEQIGRQYRLWADLVSGSGGQWRGDCLIYNCSYKHSVIHLTVLMFSWCLCRFTVGATTGTDNLDLEIMGTSSPPVDLWLCRVYVCNRCEIILYILCIQFIFTF